MSFLDGANNMFGALDERVKKRLQRFFTRPSFESWDDVHGIIINDKAKYPRPRTVWQAVVEVDPSCSFIAKAYGTEKAKPKDRWSRFPDAVTVARGIKAALQP